MSIDNRASTIGLSANAASPLTSQIKHIIPSLKQEILNMETNKLSDQHAGLMIESKENS